MEKMKQYITSACAIILMLALLVSSAVALTPSYTTSVAERNAIAKNWNYLERGYKEYNCLAWSLGITDDWVWPWGSENPSVSKVITYMIGKGYVAVDSNISCSIYAYGTSNAVTHFARGRGDGPLAVPIDAKWGACELFSHTTTDPYYTIAEGGSYGKLVKGFRPLS